VRRLLEKGARAALLVHRTPALLSHPNLELLPGDLSGFDWRKLESDPPGMIYHLARMSGRNRLARRAAAWRNARANERLLGWMRSLERPPLLVFLSGTLVYGSREGEADEAAPLKPASYQYDYFTAEKPVLDAMRRRALPVMVLRAPWVYGDGSWFRKFFRDPMRSKGFVPWYGAGDNWMSLIHVDDCAALIEYLSRRGAPGEIYNLTGHPPLRQRAFAETLGAITDLSVRRISRLKILLQHDPATWASLTFSLRAATRHAVILRDFTPRFPRLEEGLHAVI
jgi:nucleoside-diphosphate-sugar epimerase